MTPGAWSSPATPMRRARPAACCRSRDRLRLLGVDGLHRDRSRERRRAPVLAQPPRGRHPHVRRCGQHPARHPAGATEDRHRADNGGRGERKGGHPADELETGGPTEPWQRWSWPERRPTQWDGGSCPWGRRWIPGRTIRTDSPPNRREPDCHRRTGDDRAERPVARSSPTMTTRRTTWRRSAAASRPRWPPPRPPRPAAASAATTAARAPARRASIPTASLSTWLCPPKR